MADVTLLVKIDGTDAESAVPVIQNTARVLQDWLQDGGHNLASCKVAIICVGCRKLINPGLGNLCDSCAREEALDRQEQEITEGLRVGAIHQPVQPAETLL